jgi:hypothetical protein
MEMEAWLLVNDGKIVGMAIFCRIYDKYLGKYYPENCWQFNRVYVDKNWRRRGIVSSRIGGWLKRYCNECYNSSTYQPLFICQPNSMFKAAISRRHIKT